MLTKLNCRERLWTLLLSMAISCTLFAQQNTGKVNGVVTSEAGSALPSVTITAINLVSKKVFTVTSDSSGKFTFLQLALSGKYSFTASSVGYESRTLSGVVLTANQMNSVVISLKESTNNLNEVVVTALGIKRDKKTLSYAIQSVSGDEIRKTASPNFMEALSGKAAGIDIKISNSGVGGSTKAVLRGSKSLTGTSEALFVIDGVPMVNNKGIQPGSYGGTDGGDGLSSLNPLDIESISILRSSNAAILYGSQGANGVILITTKKGKPGKISVEASSGVTLDQVASLPKFQYDYGNPTGGDYSWGDTVKGNYQKNYIEDFFQTGSTVANGVSVSGGSDKTTAYFSYSNTAAKGVIPNNAYNKNTVSLSQSTKLLKDKLTISSYVLFSSEKTNNRPGAGYYNNPLTGLYLFARKRDFAKYKTNYQVFDSSRNLYKMNWYSSEEKQNNPYWEINNNSKLATRSRAIANVKLSYELTKHLKFETRGNIDYSAVLFDYRYAAAGNSVSVSPNGRWIYSKYNDVSLYADALLTYTNTFGDYSLTGILGTAYQKNTFNDGISVDNSTTSLMYANYFTFPNLPYNIIINQPFSQTIKQSAFASVQAGYKDFLYADVAFRNDWASTLALTGNESYFYPTFGLSTIVSEMVKLPTSISFLKLRASYSITGNEVPYNVVNPQHYIGGAGGPSGIGGITRNTQVPFTNLEPEKIQSNEAGFEVRFFNNKLGLDFTYYKAISTNQFLSLTAPSGSGYTTYFVNAGKIVNKGLELTINAYPVSNNKFQWNTSLNLSQNKNKIEELIASNPSYQVGGDSEGFASIIKAGGSFNDLYIFKFNRNAEGKIILSNAGIPTKAPTQTYAGSLNPDLLAGWNNTISFGNFIVSALVNAKFGGVAFSKTEAFLDSYGVSERSAKDRDRNKGVMAINAIQGTTNISSIKVADYYSAIGDRNNIMEPYVFSRTNIRLGQLALSYSPKIKPSGSVVKSATFSLIGRNLFFFYKKAPFDPEQAMSTSNSQQSNDVFSLPPVRSYGFNVKLTF